MSKIEPNIVGHTAGIADNKSHLSVSPDKLARTNHTATDQKNTQASSNISISDLNKIIGNRFLKSPIKTDCFAFKKLSNQALITQLSSIELSLADANRLNLSEQEFSEIELGRIMVGELIRRLLITVTSDSSQNIDISAVQQKED